MHPIILGLVTIVIGVGGCLAYFFLSNLILDKVIFPAKAGDRGRNINRANAVRPWLFLFPAIFALGLYLGYPVFETLRLSLTDRDAGGAFVGLANYQQMMSEDKFWEALRNNLLWLIIVPAASTAFGLLAAQLTDRIAWGNIAKSIIFMPMAISFVGASVIFKLVYDTRPVEQDQIGVVNAIWLQFDGGIGSFIVLRLLPAFLLVAFVAMIAYAIKGLIAQLRNPHNQDGLAFKALRVFSGVVGLWLIVKCLMTVVSIFTVSYIYGEPQTFCHGDPVRRPKGCAGRNGRSRYRRWSQPV